MTNRITSFRISHKKSNNNIYKVFTPSNDRISTPSNNTLEVPTYFIRLKGANGTAQYKTLLNDLTRRLDDQSSNIRITSNFESSSDPSLIASVKNIFSEIDQLTQDSITRIITKTISDQMGSITEESLKSALIAGTVSISLDLLKIKPNYSVTQYRNFFIKLMGWLKVYVLNKANEYHKSLEKGQFHIPKFMVLANIKLSEALFLRLCNFIGYDILAICPEGDQAFAQLDPQMSYSELISLPNTISVIEARDLIVHKSPSIGADKLINQNRSKSTQARPTVNTSRPKVDTSRHKVDTSRPKTDTSRPRVDTSRPGSSPSNTSTASRQTHASSGIRSTGTTTNPAQLKEAYDKLSTPINITDKITTSLKDVKDPISDFDIIMNNRGGFIGGPSPVFTVYFVRYIGVDKNLNTYYNKLFRLNNTLSMKENYSFFDGSVKVLSDQEAISKTSTLWQLFETVDAKTTTVITNYLYKNGVFPYFSHKLMENTVVHTFKKILDFYIDNESNVNKNQLKNFTLKQLFWVRHYMPKLYKGLDPESKEIYNPKALYYGPIKKHEGYFLMLLSLLGTDVMYINSKDDDFFNELDPSMDFSKPFKLENASPLRPFPTQEIVTQQETVAYRASQEINEILFDETTGVYAPWQFENYLTHSHTLKTTYDEMKILWPEESRMRDGFKVKGDTVYVPNIFAKISGTSEDINEYWSDIKVMKSGKNTWFIDKVPFTDLDQATANSYAAGFVFKPDGSLDIPRLKSNSIYKIGHLKNGTQNLILNKIQDLTKSKLLTLEKDKLLNQKILLTVMNLGNEVFNMISSFDKPFQIPKVVVYDNDEKMLSLEDTITIAFMYLVGFDVAVFTPTGYNNIENHINPEYFNTINLANVKFNLELPNFAKVYSKKKDKSFFQSLFGK